MNTSVEHSQAGTTATSARPHKNVFTVIEREGGRAWWTKIGAAWINRDGSLTVKLEALPVNGTLQIRDPEDRHGSRGGAQ
jgi:hypothetical protein